VAAKTRSRYRWRMNPNLALPNETSVTPAMCETIGVVFDWAGDHFRAKRALTAVKQRGIATVCHVGRYGIYDNDGRDWYVELLDNLCQQLGTTIWVDTDRRDVLDPATASIEPRPLLRHTQHQFVLPKGRYGDLATLRPSLQTSAAAALVTLTPIGRETEWIVHTTVGK
jgi:hypothetical protein